MSGAPETTPETPAVELSPAEQASVQKAKDGLSEVNPNALPDTTPQRPDYVPEKFWDAETGEVNVENLAKSYGELEKSRSAPKEEPEAAAEEPSAEPSKDGKIVKPETPEAPAENPMGDLFARVAEEHSAGEVSEETFGALEAAGIPKEIAQNYLAGLAVMAEQTLTTIHGYTEGAENYGAMAKWAGDTLTDAELESFNAALDNPQLRETAVRGLYARFQAVAPNEGTLTSPKGPQPGAGDVYSEKSQVLADMRKPEYQNDPAFRAEVEQKLARSQRSGFKMREEGLFERRIINT